MLVAPALPILLLLLGTLGLLEEALAVGLALCNGVVQLIGWGIDVGRRRGQAWPTALLTGLVNSALGVVIILVEVQLHSPWARGLAPAARTRHQPTPPCLGYDPDPPARPTLQEDPRSAGPRWIGGRA
jgi:hypothetical protein